MAQTFNSSLKKVAFAYATLLKIPVTKTSLQSAIEENPYYPSLFSLSDTFDRFNIRNAAYNVPTDEIDHLKAPFIAYMSVPDVGSDFVLVTGMSDNAVDLIYNLKRPQKIAKQQFIEQFRNTALFAELNENSGERDFEVHLKKEKIEKNKLTLTITSAILLLLFLVVANGIAAKSLAYMPITFIKLCGLATTVFLLVYEIDKSNIFVKNICTAGARSNCDAVLGSQASKIWGVSWSEIGFFYFCSTTILLLMPGMSFSDKKGCLAFLNIFAAPYILFSIYYQWRIVHQWCLLCLTVQACLAAELIWSAFNFWRPVHSLLFFTTNGFAFALGVAFALLMPIVAWYTLKPIFFKAKDQNLYKNAYKRLQYNPDIFNGLLTKQDKTDNWQQLGILIGDPNAENTIIKVCNPYCGPCAKAHPTLEDIVTYNKNVNLRVIFTAKNNKDDRGAQVVRHLLAIEAQNDRAKTQQALDDWYLAPKKDYELFSSKYLMNGELVNQNDKMEAMGTWCDEVEITYTPTIFINGYRLPENYDIEELKYIF
ncbi:vitamin K epoxide reductase family protein [Mucilaginibacter sp.]|jgi:uncharacterized membrane protein|uniref:vitamin K epoxide reductase family protein n=1 Tax=Mucilaginibacter sp. TaxID=1882438 RepID=UPI002CE7EF81|nr:vitamin K epoxide reductase family protein [Mucilaginibacter sp.]HTI60148.1 vitamin K epoxide reductase family protein [Mucilaginibacter sp.]